MANSQKETRESLFKEKLPLLVMLQKLFGSKSREKLESQEQLSDELTAEELAPLMFLVVRSQPGSHKFESMMSHWRQNYRVPLKKELVPAAFHEPEEIPEEEYNFLPITEQNPRLIAAIKAHSILGHSGFSRSGKAISITEFINKLVSRLGSKLERFKINEIGCMAVFRAQDVVTDLVVKGESKRQLKPKSKDKHKIFDNLCQIFDTDNESRPEEVELVASGAEALHEAISDIGVVCETKSRLKMRNPDRAFLHCLIRGTKDVPDEFQATANQFEAIYREASKNPVTLIRTRGWTPETGMSEPYKVNAGFHTDSIFVEKLLVISVIFETTGEIRKGEPGFDQAMEAAIRLIRGEPVSFNRTYRALLQIVCNLESGFDVGVEPSKTLNSITSELRREIGEQHLHLPRVFGGTWYDISSDQKQVPLDRKSQTEFVAQLIMMNIPPGKLH